MLDSTEVQCPYCQAMTMIATASPDSTGKYERKGSITACRKCGQRLITLTEEDGTVLLFRPEDLGG